MKNINIEEYFKNKYSSLITHKYTVSPKYEVICFNDWIELELHNTNFLNDIEREEYYTIRKEKNLYGSQPIWKNSEIKSFNINELYFYQDEIGIKGPIYTKKDEPVNVINFMGKYILENGYHRLSARIISGYDIISAKVVYVNN